MQPMVASQSSYHNGPGCVGHKCMREKPRWRSSTGCIARPEPRRYTSQPRSNADCATCTRWSSKVGYSQRRWRMRAGSDCALPHVGGTSSSNAMRMMEELVELFTGFRFAWEKFEIRLWALHE